MMAIIWTSHYWGKSVPHDNLSLKAVNGLSSAISMLGVKIMILFLPPPSGLSFPIVNQESQISVSQTSTFMILYYTY